MQYEAILLTLAEVSIAFAGFSGVVIVLGRRPDSPNANAMRTLGMVMGALQAVVYSVLPLLFFESGLAPETSWRWACAVYGVGNGVGTAFFFSRLRREPGYQAHGLAPFLWFLAVGFSALTVAAALGLFGGFAAVVYILALANTLAQTAFGFIQLLSLHLSTPAE